VKSAPPSLETRSVTSRGSGQSKGKCNGYLDGQLDIESFGICAVLGIDIIDIWRLLAVLVLLCCMGAGVWLYFHHTELLNALLPLTIVISFAAAEFGYPTLAERTA
jgi:hypothetical protein